MDPSGGENRDKGNRSTGRGQRPGARHDRFFIDVADGAHEHRPDLSRFKPTVDIRPIQHVSDLFQACGLGDFDRHIQGSIPTFFEMQRAVAAAIAETAPGEGPVPARFLLDIGASEGTFCKVISALTSGRVETRALDPNPAMEQRFHENMGVCGAYFHRAAFGGPERAGGTGWIDGEVVPYFEFHHPYDVVCEIMTFQFLFPERARHIQWIAENLTSEGCFITCEKFLSYVDEAFINNEVAKEKFKSQYFGTQQLLDKKSAVLAKKGGMNITMAYAEDMERILSRAFRCVVQFWDAGNFKGYIAAHSDIPVRRFLNSLIPLNSLYSTVRTPRIVQR